MGKLNELNAEAKKLGYKYYWEKGADKNCRVDFRSSDYSFGGIFDKDGYRLNYTSNQRTAGPSKESVDLAEKFYKVYSELQRKIEPGRNDWKQDAALLKELKEADDGKRPSSSIWGRPDHCKKLAPGVYTVDTPGHGGIMVSASVASKVLSPQTLAHCSGLLENGYYQFEEDCDAAIPLVEMYRKGISEGYSWNEGRQAKFYELAQEEVLKWNAPLFESWAESREKEGPSADKGFWSTMTKVLPKAQLEEFKEDLHDPKKAERWKKVARAVASADKVGTQKGDKPSPLALHYVRENGAGFTLEYFASEIGSDGKAWGYRLPSSLLGKENWEENADWEYFDLNELKADPLMRLDPDVPEGTTIEAWLCEKHPDFFPEFKEFTITSEGKFGNLLREYGVSGEKVLEGLSERQKETFRSAWAEMSGGPMELSWAEQDEIVKKGFAAFKGLSEKTLDNPESYEPKPVPLEDIVGQMDFRLEITESGKLKLWDLQRNEYLDNERLDGSPFGSEAEKYAPSNLEFSSAEEVFDRLDSFIRDYFYADMASELERVGAATENASSLYDLCELWKAELEKGSETLSKGELDLALGIVNPDTVIMPEKYVSAKKDYEKKLKDFNELVYEYGASGTKALEGFSEEQRLVVRLAWKEYNEEDSLEETDEKINSHFEEFMAASKPAAEQTASEEKVTCENFQKKLAERAERDAIKTAQALLSEMDAAEREKFNGIVRSQGLKKPEDVDAFFAALAKGTAAFEPKERKRTPPEPGLGM